MSSELIDLEAVRRELESARPEVLDLAKEILKRSTPLATQVLSRSVSPTKLVPTNVVEALASANELDESLKGKVRDREEATALVMKILKVTGQIALRTLVAAI